MSAKSREAIEKLQLLIPQTPLILELFEEGFITSEEWRAYLEGQWAVIHRLHGIIRDAA